MIFRLRPPGSCDELSGYMSYLCHQGNISNQLLYLCTFYAPIIKQCINLAFLTINILQLPYFCYN
jgi:hypothetical protein